jgi:ABC-2 type transport system permease protein
MNPALLRLEIRRLVRNRRTLVFSLVLPAFFFLAFSAGSEGQTVGGLSVAPYVMVSMATYGAMNALFTGGGLIAAERNVGWTRQLRIAGLPGRDYVFTKASMNYLTAIPGVLAVFILGAVVKDVHLSASTWLFSGLSVLLGLLPIAALGLIIGYLVSRPQTLQPLFGIGSALLALAGGLWVPIESFPSGMQDVMKALPMYWSAQAGRDVILGSWVGWTGLAVITVWTVALGVVAMQAYHRDSLRPAAAGAA